MGKAYASNLSQNAEFLGHPQIRFWQLIPFFWHRKAHRKFRNVDNEQIILQNAMYKIKAATSWFLPILFDFNIYQKKICKVKSKIKGNQSFGKGAVSCEKQK